MSRYYHEHGDDYFHGNSSRNDAQRGARRSQTPGNRDNSNGFPSVEEAWSRGARLESNPRLLARMPWVLHQAVRNEQFVRGYLSGRVFPCGTLVEAIYSYDWLNRIAVPDAELFVGRNETVRGARERLIGQVSVRYRRHHQPLQAIPSDFGVDAYAYRTLGEIGYVNTLVELDVSRWYGNPTVDSEALCWAAPIIRAEFRYVCKPKLFWEWTQWERRFRARSRLLVPYQCIEAENLLTEVRHWRWTPVPLGFGKREMSPGCRAELSPVVTYKGSGLSYDPNSGYWTVFNTEWAARIGVWILWDVYDSYRLWYIPRQVRADMRAVKLDFVLGGVENENELHRLISVVDSVNWRAAEYVYTRPTDRSFEEPSELAPGDFIWYDPWRRERISKEEALRLRETRREIPAGHPRGYVYRERELRNTDLEVTEEDADPGILPVTTTGGGNTAGSSGPVSRVLDRSADSAFGFIRRTPVEESAAYLDAAATYFPMRAVLRDCGVHANEM